MSTQWIQKRYYSHACLIPRRSTTGPGIEIESSLVMISKHVHIIIAGTTALITPAVPAAITALTLQDVSFSVRNGQLVPTETTTPSFARRLKEITTAVGFVPRIIQVLEAAGHLVTVRDTRQWSERFRTATVNAGTLEGEAMLQQVKGTAVGQIEVSDHHGTIHAMADLCRLYPDARVLVLTSSKRKAERLHHDLQGALRQDVQFMFQTGWKQNHRVAVSLYGYLPPDAADILLLPDAVEATSLKAQDRLWEITKSGQYRVFAFRLQDTRLTPRQELLLERFAGLVIHRDGLPLVPVHVALADAWSSPTIDSDSALSRKQTAIWHNEQRNALIAHLAMSLVNHDMPALWEAGLLLDQQEVVAGGHAPLPVSILVESPEQGRQLQRLLPDWPLRQLYGHNPAHDGPGEIVTMAFAAEEGIASPVILRADGSDSPLALPRFPNPAFYNAFKSVLIVDVTDDVDRVARRDVRRRIKQYQERQWHLSGDRRWQQTPGPLIAPRRKQTVHAGNPSMTQIPA